MDNLFYEWNRLKITLNNKLEGPLFNEREICFVSIGQNIGREQHGRHQLFERPVLVYKKFGEDSFLGIPLSSQVKQGKFYFTFPLQKEGRQKRINSALLSQILFFDTRRIQRKMGYISEEDYILLQEKLQKLLFSHTKKREN